MGTTPSRWNDLGKPGRCTKCRKIGPRSSPLGLCAKCTAWTEGGEVGPTPLAPEIAESHMLLVDPGHRIDRWGEGEDRDDGMLRRALGTPAVQEDMRFAAEHRNYDCSEYDACLRIACCQPDWLYFTCRGCKFFQKKVLTTP